MSTLSTLAAFAASFGGVSASPDTAAVLRADILPYLECDRRFNGERIRLETEDAELYRAPWPVGIENVNARKQRREKLDTQSRELLRKSASECKMEANFAKFEARVKELNPKYSDRELRNFSWNLFATIREIDRDLHRYQVGQYNDDPVAPPIKKSSQ